MLSRRAVIAVCVAGGLPGQRPGSVMFSNAEAYERFMGRWSRLVAPLLVDFADVPDRGQVLDVGSGTGSLAFSIAATKTNARVVGIDPSKEYVDYAASRNRFPDRVSFETGDAQELRFANATFQASVSLLVLNFIPDPGQALRELRRVTKAGGRISAAVWDYGSGMRMLRVFWDAVVSVDASAEKLDEKRMPLCRAGELAHLWKQGGLEDVREKALDVSLRFESFTDYWDAFLLGQGPAGAYVTGLDETHRVALRDEVKRRLAVTSGNSPFTLPARTWAVRGVVPQ